MAYALESLIQILEQDHTHLIINIIPKIKPLLEISVTVRNILANISPLTSRSVLEKIGLRIRDAAQEAEDIIESYIASLQLLGFQAPVPEMPNLSHIEKVLDSVKQELSKMAKASSVPTPISIAPEGVENERSRVIGFDEDIRDLHAFLLSHDTSLRVIPIIGMGGSGKTTLAREVYIKYRLDERFDCRAWVTISQNFNARATFLTLLKELRKITSNLEEESDERLGEYVHKTLTGRRYFIVIDDMWDVNVWDRLKKFFPDDKKGSRIFVTSREMKVASYVRVGSDPHMMHPLNEEQSWELLSERVYGSKPCPEFLVETGKKIAVNCKGLPLALVVMAGLLLTTEETIDFWDLIEENVGSAGAKHNFEFMEILALSYIHLPYYLKPCFLYVGAFPEDHEIRASRMVDLWVSEGMLKPIAGNTLEETAEEYLQALIDRNLIIVRSIGCRGKMRTFGIHDLMRTLSHSKAYEEQFIWFENVKEHKGVEIVRRVCARPSSEFHKKMEAMSPARSFVCIGHPPLNMAYAFLPLKLLRILDVFNMQFFQYPQQILRFVNLRYLAFSGYPDLPMEITRFKYLRTLVVRRVPSFRSYDLTSELWELAHLRNVKSKETVLMYFPTDDENLVLENLQSLSSVQSSGITNQLLKRIRNLRKLGLCCNDEMPEVINLCLLEKLEKLKCTTDWSLASHIYLFSIIMPDTIVKLTLTLCKIPKVFMKKVGLLPNLEQLKLVKSDFLGPNDEITEEEWVENAPEWETDDEGFRKLQLLEMRDLNLVKWIADDASFPVLREIIIRDCCEMRELPLELGDINTLEVIEVDESSPLIISSLMEIQKEQKKCGNTTLECIFYTSF